MAKTFITPRINRLFIDSVEAITTEMGKRHKFVVVTEATVACPNCIQDVTTGASTGKYKTGGPKAFTGKVCPVCQTKGKSTTVKRRTVTANVTLGRADPGPNGETPQGQVLKGFAEVETSVRNKPQIVGATYFLVDDQRYSMHIQPEGSGLQTIVNIFFTLKRDQ